MSKLSISVREEIFRKHGPGSVAVDRRTGDIRFLFGPNKEMTDRPELPQVHGMDSSPEMT